MLLYLFCLLIRPQEWMPGLQGLRVINGLALLTAYLLFIERLGFRKYDFVKVPQNYLMVGFFGSILMSHIVHTYLGGLMQAFSAFLVNFVLFFLVMNAVNTKQKYKITIWFFVILVFALVHQGMYQVINEFGWAGQPLTYDYLTGEFRINWIGIFNDPNDLALIFVVAIGMIIPFIFGRASFIQRIMSCVFFGYLIYGVYLTNSRGGLLALMATGLFYFYKKTGKWIWGVIIGGVFVMAVLAYGPSRIGNISTQEASAYGRIHAWYEGVQLIKSNPIFGVGYDMFLEDLKKTAHNSFILAAAELGLVGLFFWMSLIYTSYKGLSLIQEKAGMQLRPYARGLQSGLIGFCASAFFLSRTYVIVPYIIFALAGSLMHVAKKEDSSLDFSYKKKDVRNTILWCLCVLGAAYATVKVGI